MGLDLHRKDEAGWRSAFEGAGFTDVSTQRVIDSRGPGTDCDECEPTAEAKKALHEAGTLWIRGLKPE